MRVHKSEPSQHRKGGMTVATIEQAREVALSLERRERGRVGSVNAAREQLAGLLGVSRTTVARWETGTRKLGKDWLTKVARKTGIAPAKLRPDLAELMRV